MQDCKGSEASVSDCPTAQTAPRGCKVRGCMVFSRTVSHRTFGYSSALPRPEASFEFQTCEDFGRIGCQCSFGSEVSGSTMLEAPFLALQPCIPRVCFQISIFGGESGGVSIRRVERELVDHSRAPALQSLKHAAVG